MFGMKTGIVPAVFICVRYSIDSIIKTNLS